MCGKNVVFHQGLIATERLSIDSQRVAMFQQAKGRRRLTKITRPFAVSAPETVEAYGEVIQEQRRRNAPDDIAGRPV